MSLSEFARQHNERLSRQRGWVETAVPEVEPESAACAVLATPLAALTLASASRPKLFREELPPDTDKYVLVADLTSQGWSTWLRDSHRESWKEEFYAHSVLRGATWWLPMPALPKKDG
jgi:hypothetical protein